MKKHILSLAFFCIVSPCYIIAQDPNAVKFSETITAEDLKKHLTVLASDEYEGRETGKKGQKMAADYIAAQFESDNFPKVVAGSYFQKYPLIEKIWGERKLIVNQTPYTFLKDFYCFGSEVGAGIKINTNEIVFAGYGIQEGEMDDYKGLDVKGKIVLMLRGEPVNKKGISAVTKTEQKSEWSTEISKKIENARKLNPALILIIENDMEQSIKKYSHTINRSSVSLPKNVESPENYVIPCIYISKTIAEDLLKPNNKKFDEVQAKIDNSGKFKPFLVNSTVNVVINRLKNNITAENVLGYLKGSEKPDELIVVTAHYDHLGIVDGEVYNGADDDGSGTVSVIELAQAFAEAAKNGFAPKRSMLFMTVSGEEKGLLGSSYYSDHPVFPLENTVADLNIDMVGRIDKEHKDKPDYVYVIGSDKLSSQLHEINEQVNKTYTKLNLDYTYNDPKDPNRFYYRSDHYNFAKKNVPIIFYFNGTHEDYHKPSDELDKINFDMMAKRAKLVFFTAWELANRAQRITVDKVNDFPTK